VIKKVNEADPHHGEMWCKEAKKVENWRLKPDQIVVKAVQELRNEFNE